MIRILDRYLLRFFLAALGVFTAAFAALFVVIDFAAKVGNFLSLKGVPLLPFIARYYLVRLPMVLTYLLPTVVLFAAIFTVIKLARNNEILPVVASGTSLRRMSLPFLLTAVLAAGVMAAMDEYVLARLGTEIIETEDALQKEDMSYGVTAYDGRMLVYAKSFEHLRRRMKGARITRLNEDMKQTEIVHAEECLWESARGRFVAYGGQVEYPGEWVSPPDGRPHQRREEIGPRGYELSPGITPESVRRSSSLASRFPFSRLRDLMAQARKNPHVPSFRMKIHSRFAFPLSPIILLLLGLPFVAVAGSRSFLNGIFFCFILALAYYMTYFACLDLANNGEMEPALAVWGSTGIFGALGLAAFGRMKT